MACYVIYDVKCNALEGTQGARIAVAQGYNLSRVLKLAKKYTETAPEWKNAPKIEIRVNGNDPYRTPAAYLRAYRHKVLTHNFQRQIEVVRL